MNHEEMARTLPEEVQIKISDITELFTLMAFLDADRVTFESTDDGQLKPVFWRGDTEIPPILSAVRQEGARIQKINVKAVKMLGEEVKSVRVEA